MRDFLFFGKSFIIFQPFFPRNNVNSSFKELIFVPPHLLREFSLLNRLIGKDSFYVDNLLQFKIKYKILRNISVKKLNIL